MRELIKGQTIQVTSTFYTDEAKTTLANLTGASIYFIAKYRPDDTDANKIFEKTLGSGITVVTLTDGTKVAVTVISASDTNSLTVKQIYCESIAKLADGTIIRNGINPIEVKGNVRTILP